MKREDETPWECSMCGGTGLNPFLLWLSLPCPACDGTGVEEKVAAND